MSFAAAPSARLKSVDGWRAVAVFGVIWWHAWIHTGNPAFPVRIGSFDINLERLPVLLGNGVDFFFVLSGFCIYLGLGRSLPSFTLPGYGRFVFNRWRRLSPAFYVICAATAGALFLAGQSIGGTNLLAHALWLQGVWPGASEISPAFWSLQVEWEFYLCAPLLLLIPQPAARWTFLGALLLACLGLRYVLHDNLNGVATGASDHLPMHLTGFVAGMAIAEGWRTRAHWLEKMHGMVPLLAGLVIAFLGRGLQSTEAFVWLGNFGVLAKTVGAPLMTCGFALTLAATLGNVPGVSALLASNPFQTVGRLSYGLYLWHWWPCVWIGHALRAHYGDTVIAHYLALAGTFAVCTPLAWLTYVTCERFYFRSHAQSAAVVPSAPSKLDADTCPSVTPLEAPRKS